MASFLYSKISQDYLIWCIDVLRIFTIEIMKFRVLILETRDLSLEVHYVTSTLDICEKLEHISDVIICMIRNKQRFIEKMTALVDIQKKLKEAITQAKISTGPLAVREHEAGKCTKEKVKENTGEEKPSKENPEAQNNEGDPTEAKPLKEDYEEQKTNPGETISEKELEGDPKDVKPDKKEAGKPW